MIKRNLLFLFFTVMLSGFPKLLVAQELSVKSFAEKLNDLIARIEAREDNNGVQTAVVKVLLAASGAEFDGLVVGKPVIKTGEYWVFMADGAKRLTVRLPGYLPLTVTFSDYHIQSLTQKTTYELVITGLKAHVQDTIKVQDTVFLTKETIIESPLTNNWTYVMRSAFVPGLGQMAKGHSVEGILTLTGEVATVGAGIGSYVLAQRALRILEGSPTDYSVYANAKRQYNTYRTINKISFGTAATLYAFNLIMAYTDTLKKHDQMTLYPSLNYEQGSWVPTMGLTFKF